MEHINEFCSSIFKASTNTYQIVKFFHGKYNLCLIQCIHNGNCNNLNSKHMMTNFEDLNSKHVVKPQNQLSNT